MNGQNTDWVSIIKRMAPLAKPSIVSGLSAAMPKVIQIAGLTTPQRMAQFLAQIAHESDGFRTTTEYASGREYNNRKDLGNGPTDGPTFKGRGLIQLTGRYNYQKYGDELGVDFIKNPSLAAQFPYAALTAAQYWKNNKLNNLADQGDIYAITRRINGGFNGLSDRKRYLALAEAELSPIKQAQQRLSQLNYPVGKPDGISGPLTRSAIRDFQDAANLPVTGDLDAQTFSLLASDHAPVRPVAPERAAITADDLRERGSEIISGTDQAKFGAIGSGIAAAAGAADQINGVVSNVQTIAQTAKSGVSALDLFKMYWPVIFGVVAALAACYFAWKCYQGADKAEKSRVKNAKTGVNVAR